jgi:uncharacterized protein
MGETMATGENAAIVRRAYEAFNTADMETMTGLLDEGVTWHTPGRNPLAGDHRGRDTVLAHFGEYGQGTDGTFRAELKYVCADDEGHVIALHRNTGTRAGKRLDVDCCIVFELENGRCVDAHEHFYDLHAWDEFWS